MPLQREAVARGLTAESDVDAEEESCDLPSEIWKSYGRMLSRHLRAVANVYQRHG